MTIKKRLCVVGIIAYAPGERLSTPYEDAGLRWLFDATESGSIPSFWRESTGGLVDITCDVFGFLFIESAEWVQKMLTPDRAKNSQAACDIATGNGINVGGYDGFVAFIGGRGVGAGKSGVEVDDRAIPAALLDDRGPHMFMAHEVGHVVGFNHPYRTSWTNPNGPLYGEYGDPYCIMSAMTYGNYPVTRVVNPGPKAGINANAELWTAGGPGPAAATLWRYMPGYPQPQPWVQILPEHAPATTVTLTRPGADGTRLVAMPRSGGGWWTVEYRPSVDWDNALSLNPKDFSNAPGLVVHSIHDVGTNTDPPPYPLDDRVCYENTIPVPSAGDSDWDNGRLAVRVLEEGPGSVRVMIGETLPDTKAARMGVTTAAGEQVRYPGAPIDLILVGPSCGNGTYNTEFADNPYIIEVNTASMGFTKPQFQFSINGVPIGTWSELDGPAQSGTVTFNAELARPTGYQTAETVTETISAGYNVATNRLGITLPGGDGRYSVTIKATVADRVLDSSVSEATTEETIDVSTRWIDLSAEAKAAQNECQRFLTEKGMQQAPPGPKDPIGPVAVPNDWGNLGNRKLVDALKRLENLKIVDPALAKDKIGIAAKELHVQPGVISAAAERFRAPR